MKYTFLTWDFNGLVKTLELILNGLHKDETYEETVENMEKYDLNIVMNSDDSFYITVNMK